MEGSRDRAGWRARDSSGEVEFVLFAAGGRADASALAAAVEVIFNRALLALRERRGRGHVGGGGFELGHTGAVLLIRGFRLAAPSLGECCEVRRWAPPSGRARTLRAGLERRNR